MNEDNIIIRKATPEDFHSIIKLYRIKEGHKKHNQIKNWLFNEQGIFHVAVIDTKIVGGVAIRFPTQNEAWLSHKLISQDMHNQGLGTVMAKYEEEIAKKNNASHIRLATRINNYPIHWMIGEKLGYHQISRWLRIRRIYLSKSATLPYFHTSLESSNFELGVPATEQQTFIENHIDFQTSHGLILSKDDSSVYHQLNFKDPNINSLYKTAILRENNQIKSIALYNIDLDLKELVIYQIYSNQQEYTYFLLYQLILHAKNNKLYFSLLSSKPVYPMKNVLKRWRMVPFNHYRSDWFILGKIIKK